MEGTVYSVGQINRYIRNMLENDVILNSFWVSGELSNVKLHSSGHLYATLKDATAAIQCVMFRDAAETLTFLPENGLSVLVCGYVSVYEKTGQYQLYVQDMEPLGIGSLALAFEQLKQKLTTEGLFDTAYKREITPYPHCVAIVTSPTGAAVRDVIQIIKRRNISVKIVVVPVLVQGEYAPNSIVEGIRLVNRWGKADTIIVGRGGGSIEDLWAFNEESVARAIFASEIPVISAVGHETDVTIADFVADLRAPTPSAAAELAVRETKELQGNWFYLVEKLQKNVENALLAWKRQVELATSSVFFRRPLEKLQQHELYVEQLKKRLEKEIQHQMEKKKTQFLALENRLESSSPFGILGRGYLLAETEGGKPIQSVGELQVGEQILLHFQDGQAKVTVKERRTAERGEEENHI